MVHVQYHKGQRQTSNYKENARFLANSIAKLLLDYIVYILPLRERFLRQTSPASLVSPYLWEKDGKVWPEGHLSRYLEQAGVPRYMLGIRGPNKEWVSGKLLMKFSPTGRPVFKNGSFPRFH